MEFRTRTSNANDAVAISNIIDTLLSYSNVDENKIFAVGNSNGSGMVNVLGGFNKILKAIAPVASQLTRTNRRPKVKRNSFINFSGKYGSRFINSN